MRSNIARYNFFFSINHWILALLIFILIGLGWYLQYVPDTSEQEREFLLALHTSIGITSAILLFIQLSMRIACKPPPYPDDFPKWQRTLGYTLYFFIYASFSLILMSGYMQAVFSGGPIQFWGLPLPGWSRGDLPLAEFLGPFWGAPLRIWDMTDVTSAGFFGALHGTMVSLLVGLIFAHIGIVTMNTFKHPGFAARMLPSRAPEPSASEQPSPPVSLKIAQGLAKRLRLSGWIEVWVQLVLALITAILLEFATSGRAFSPGSAGFGDAIYWGVDGFLLLWIAILLAFYYTRAARKIVSRPDSYLSKTSVIALWFLVAGMLTGILGVFISFTGVALSISLLIAKTVSQPPGIAITDPNKIIRALDVFILIVNFNLLMAHFIGAGVALWLGISTQSARLKYMETAHKQELKL